VAPSGDDAPHLQNAPSLDPGDDLCRRSLPEGEKIIAGLAERYAISAVKIMPDAVVKGCGKNGAKENR
jgi:hypothetical protein